VTFIGLMSNHFLSDLRLLAVHIAWFLKFNIRPFLHPEFIQKIPVGRVEYAASFE